MNITQITTAAIEDGQEKTLSVGDYVGEKKNREIVRAIYPSAYEDGGRTFGKINVRLENLSAGSFRTESLDKVLDLVLVSIGSSFDET